MLTILSLIVAASIAQTAAQYPYYQQPGLNYPGLYPQPLQPFQPSGSIGGQNKEAICGLRSFADLKCPTGSSSCKKCVVDTVSSSCPYNPSSGSPDCEKLKACATRLAITCA